MTDLDPLSEAIRSFSLETAQSLLTSKTAANLTVYATAYATNLQQVLERVYPVTLELLGPNNFRFFARHYSQQHPPRAASLDHYGNQFAEFLACDPRLQQTQPMLAHFAKLDWFHHFPLAPTSLEIDLPGGLADAYQRLATGLPLESTDFARPHRHRLLRDRAR